MTFGASLGALTSKRGGGVALRASSSVASGSFGSAIGSSLRFSAAGAAGAALLDCAQAEPMAIRLASLKRRASAAGVPTIYINDNFGQWRSDFRKTVAHCISRSSPGRRVSHRLRPMTRDYFVLKPKHSGFFDTTLDTLLGTLRIRRVIVTGIAGNICVLFTANDAYMRGLKIFAPADCIVSNTAADNNHALRQIHTVLKGNVAESFRLTFRAVLGGGRRTTTRRQESNT